MSTKKLFNIRQKSEMQEVVDKLNEARESYYNDSKEIMSNKEYDELYDKLEDMERSEGVVLPNSPTHNVGAPIKGDLPKFEHTYPALSLHKTKDIEELYQAFEKGIQISGNLDRDVVIMWKEDGATVQAYYDEGILQKLVTRGNGYIGSIITHNAKNIEGLPLSIPYKGEMIVRGEALMSYDEFERINSQIDSVVPYKNPRNLASATLSMLDSEEAGKRKLAFKAFNLVYISDETAGKDLSLATSFSDRLSLLDDYGFEVVERCVCNIMNLKKYVDRFTENADNYDYPVDGLVVAMDNFGYSRKLEGTEHHPNIMQGYAFKWADETKETILREVEWSPSRTGLLNPVAIFDPIELEGTTVKRASLHNLSIMKKMRIHVGDRLTVYKANMIIPTVDCNLDLDNHEDNTTVEVPICPTCGEAAVVNVSPDGIETVYCPNENCPEKLIGKLVNFCSRDCMDIQGMSEETIKKLVEAGIIKDYADFFNLDSHKEIASMPGFGEISWNNMCQSAMKARSTDFVRFITALSIPNIGKGQAKLLKDFLIKNYEVLARDHARIDPKGFNLCVLLSRLGHFDYDFALIDGFGPVLAKGLTHWLKTHFDLDPMNPFTPELNVFGYLTFTDEPKSNLITLSSISGKTFCITGKLEHFINRQELVDKIESLGGKWIDSVSSKTNYLINNDVTSSSGKNKKAKELNIPIISENDFLKMIQ